MDSRYCGCRPVQYRTISRFLRFVISHRRNVFLDVPSQPQALLTWSSRDSHKQRFNSRVYVQTPAALQHSSRHGSPSTIACFSHPGLITTYSRDLVAPKLLFSGSVQERGSGRQLQSRSQAPNGFLLSSLRCVNLWFQYWSSEPEDREQSHGSNTHRSLHVATACQRMA